MIDIIRLYLLIGRGFLKFATPNGTQQSWNKWPYTILSLHQANKIVSVHYQRTLDKDFNYFEKLLRQNEKYCFSNCK